jgi:hypothetical protein
MVQEYSPNTIWLGGMGITPVHTYSAGEAITPGQLVILVSDGGTPKWYKANSATNIQPVWVALEQDEQNLGIDDNYAAGDLVKVAALGPGCTFYGLIPSGQDIAVCDYLQSNGDGNLKEATAVTAAANVARYQSLTNAGAVVALTRVKVQVVQ